MHRNPPGIQKRQNFWSCLKRTLHGTYIAPRAFHLGAYVDEQVFRFNVRHDADGQRFVEALKGTDGRRLTWGAYGRASAVALSSRTTLTSSEPHTPKLEAIAKLEHLLIDQLTWTLKAASHLVIQELR